MVEFAGVASALLVNTGTLSAPAVAAMRLAAAEYHALGKPWVLGAWERGSPCRKGMKLCVRKGMAVWQQKPDVACAWT